MLSGVEIGDAFKDFDGGRQLRIRYETPDWSGLYFSSAYGQEVLAEDNDTDYYDVAVRYGFVNDVIGFDAALGTAGRMTMRHDRASDRLGFADPHSDRAEPDARRGGRG